MVYQRGLDNRQGAIFLWDTKTQKRFQITSGYYTDYHPTFDPEGKYLYFFSNRTFRPAYSDLDNSFIYPNTTNVVAVALSSGTPSILAPRNDDEGPEKEKKTDKKKGKKKDRQKTTNR